MTLLAARNIALFALVTAPVIVRYGTPVIVDWRTRVLKRTTRGRTADRGKTAALCPCQLDIAAAGHFCGPDPNKRAGQRPGQ